MQRREEERQKAAVAPQLPSRPQVQTQPPVLAARPGVQSPTTPVQQPPIPSRPVAAQVAPSLPSRPTVQTVPTIPDRPALAERPIAPTSRITQETKPKRENDLPDQSRLRPWTDKTGKFTVEAAYLGVEDNKVKLHKSNGVIIGVPLDKLNDDAMNYLKSLPGNEYLTNETKQNVPAPPPTNRSTNNLAPRQDNSDLYSFNGFNWKDWLVKAGVASTDASSYASKFVEQRLDSSILADIDRDALRAMGITEGDIIRIRKAANLPAMSSATRAKAAQNEALAQQRNLEMIAMKSGGLKTKESQIAADEAYARELQNQELIRSGQQPLGPSRKPTVNHVDPAAIFEAGNLLQAVNKTESASNRTSIASNFSKPPTTQEVASSSGLGLHGRPSLNNDPWGGFTGAPKQSGSSSSSAELLKAKQQQEETQRNLEAAKAAIEKANEQARQAALIQEQAKAAQMAKQQEIALQKAQETAKQALLIQQQAAQKLMAAQLEATKATQPIPVTNVPVMNPMVGGGFNQTMNMPQMGMQPMQPIVQRPLPAPLIPTPSTAPTPGFVPVRTLAGNSGQPVQGVQSLVTQNGVQKPNWNNASRNPLILAPNQPFGNAAQHDPYAAFKEVAPNTPSIFSSPGLTNTNTGSSTNTQGMGNPAFTGVPGGLNQVTMGMNNMNVSANPGMMQPNGMGMAGMTNMGMSGMNGMNMMRPANQPMGMGNPPMGMNNMNMMQNGMNPMMMNQQGMFPQNQQMYGQPGMMQGRPGQPMQQFPNSNMMNQFPNQQGYGGYRQ
jgi:hypothetical protein